MEILIKTNLLSLNEYILKERTNKFIASSNKKKEEKNILLEILAQKIKPINLNSYPLKIHFIHYRDSLRGDIDNLQFKAKVILDTLVNNKIIVNDNLKYINYISHEFKKAPTNYIKIILEKN